MIISLDCEYTELDIKKADLISISIGTSTQEFLFKAHELEKVRAVASKATMIFVQNGVVDWFMLKRFGLELDRTRFVDTMLLEHLIDERLDHDLGSMAVRYFNDNYKSKFWEGKQSFLDATPEEADEYERKDARYTYDLGIRFLNQLKDKLKLVEHVHRLNWVLFDIETEGISVDTPFIEKTKLDMSTKIENMLPKLREEFHEYCEIWEMQKWEENISKLKTPAGKLRVVRPSFKFSSDTQLRDLLYKPSLLGYEVKAQTKSKNPSTDYDALKELVEIHPEIQSIFDYKQEKSVYATFVKGLLERVENNRVYPHFAVNGTTTGRLSSSNPNFQNMPQDGIIRNFILPDPDCLIVGADFESLEVGVECNLTEDRALLSIMLDGASKHDITAKAVGMERKDAKTLNFLCQYGGGVWKIQKTFKVSEKEAQYIYNKYWEAYSGVMKYKTQVFKELADTNQVVNKFGRVRHFDVPTNDYEKARFERQAYSHMIQGPGAEMTNSATHVVAKYLKNHQLGRLLFPVHDELVCSIKKDKTEEAKSAIVSIMESTNDLLGFKYRIKSKPYGDYECWRKA